MADGNTMHIINYFNGDMAVSVSNNDWNCCDDPAQGYSVGNIPSHSKKDLFYQRKDGHGCNGRQGQFALSVTVGGATYTVPFDFDSNGNIESSGDVPGIAVYVKQITGGTYNCALSPEV
jgi:hypothetical protein